MGWEWVVHCAGALVRLLRAPREKQGGVVAPGMSLLGTWDDGRE